MTAAIIELDDWREWHHVKDACRRDPLAHDWSDLGWIAMTDKRDALRIYARLGFHIHLLHGIVDDARTSPPLGICTCSNAGCRKSTGKHPIESGWESCDFDFAKIDCALMRDPRLNLGWRMGPQPNGSTIVCFDVDGPRELLDPLEQQFGKLPETLTAASARGIHLFFRLAPSSAIPGNVKLRGIKEIDIRSVGGQVVVAPSRHYSGAQYKWLKCMEPAELDL